MGEWLMPTEEVVLSGARLSKTIDGQDSGETQ